MAIAADESQPDQPAAPPVDRRAWWALATGSMAFVLATINVTVTNVGYDEIAESFAGSGPSVTGWILTSYSLTFASVMLLAGRAADRYGRLVVFRIGMIGMLLASVAAGFAPTALALIVARAIQGACGALTVPSSLGLVLPRFPVSKQASVVGIWASVGMVASGLAPVIAAAVLSLASWRWLYLTLVPVTVAGLVGARFTMTETAEIDRSRRLDLVGVIIGSASTFLLVFATLRGPADGWADPIVVGAFAAAVVAFPLFLWRSARHPEPLFDLRLFQIPSFAVANGAVMLSMMGAFTTWVLWPVFLINVWRYDIVAVGLALLVSPLLSGLVAILAGRWADVHGYRGVLACAAASATVAHLWALATLDERPRFLLAFLPTTVLFALGIGVMASLLNAAALRDVPPSSIATANGVHQAMRYAAGGIGVAVALAVVGDRYDVWRFDVMWLVLAVAQVLVIPLILLGYPRGFAPHAAE